MAVRLSDYRMEVLILPDDEMRERDRTSLNRLPDIGDWCAGNRLTDILRDLGQPITVHRKAWEYGLCIEGLERLGLLHEGASAIAVGAGTEPVLYHFANRIGRMVATDLYENPDNEGTPAMLDNPASFSPFPYREDRLEVYRMSGDALDFPDDTFDFAFCLSSIEHFGSRDTQRAALAEMIRVVRPGGVLCIITELILSDHTHHEYFSLEELHDLFLADPRVELVGGAPDYRISRSIAEYPVDVANSKHVSKAPHITLFHEGMVWTSFSMFLQKVGG